MKHYWIEATLVAIGLAALGLFIYCGIGNIASNQRIVSVRGLAEREVPADRVTWPLVYKTVGNSIGSVNVQLENATDKIKKFLLSNGIKNEEITVGAPSVTDLWTNEYNNNRSNERYNAQVVVTVTSNQVSMVRELMLRTGELLNQGIAISPNDWNSPIQYTYTLLNSIKPEMIQEATKNAREAAEKFAIDSDSHLGKIKNAKQGLFTIEDRDSNTPFIKEVRVVTNVDYFLVN